MYLRVAMMFLSLATIIYAMSYLKSEKGTNKTASAINVLIGSDVQPYNWCGLEFKNLILGTEVLAAKEHPLFCEVLAQFALAEIPLEDFKVIATAETAGKARKLEINSQGVFRVEGLPFRAEDLKKRLEKRSQ